ncbi:MAG: nitroreductase family protein [Desulfobulbaceae bacterium]|nr:nitroreductase family protein [Desulfobulbaceae bacterium]
MNQAILDAIFQRRSIREYSDRPVEIEKLREIIRAGSWAPSGLNNQPWRFALVSAQPVIDQLAKLTRYSHIIKAAPALIAVYLDTREIYNEVKDHQAAGACIQNMLLAAEALDLGGVWLGEILNRKAEVNHLLDLTDDYQLMAVVALGYPAHRGQRSQRKSLAELIIKDLSEDIK